MADDLTHSSFYGCFFTCTTEDDPLKMKVIESLFKSFHSKYMHIFMMPKGS